MALVQGGLYGPGSGGGHLSREAGAHFSRLPMQPPQMRHPQLGSSPGAPSQASLLHGSHQMEGSPQIMGGRGQEDFRWGPHQHSRSTQSSLALLL